MSQPVLLLDDGELDDIQELLEELNVSFARVRGGAIIQGQPQPSKLLIATPRRIDAVAATKSVGGEDEPLRVVVVEEDSVGMREQLRQIGFDYLVRRPVHNEALRLLLLHCLYSGEERRDEPRVPIGLEVPVKTGIIPRRATLADLSASGCRLLSPFPLEPGKRIKLQIPEALGVEKSLTLPGRVVRMSLEERRGEDNLYNSAVVFDELRDEKREQLEWVLQERTAGPPTLAYVEQSPTGDVQLGPLPLEKMRADTMGGFREINRVAQRDPRAEPASASPAPDAHETRAPAPPDPEPVAALEMAAPEAPDPNFAEPEPELEVSESDTEYEPEVEQQFAGYESKLTSEDLEEAASESMHQREESPAPTVVDAPSYESLLSAQQGPESASDEDAAGDPSPADEQTPSWTPPTAPDNTDPVRSELKGLAAMLAAGSRGELPPSPPRPEGDRESSGSGGSLAAGLRNLAADDRPEPEEPEQVSVHETAEPEIDVARPNPFFSPDAEPEHVAETSAPQSIESEAGPQLTADAHEPELATQQPSPMERRKDPRGTFDVKVPAFGSRALRVLVGRDISRGGMRVEHSPDLGIGDRLHLAIYGEAGEEPFLVWATVKRDDGAGGMGLVFDEVPSELTEKLERLVGGLPAVESLHDDEASAMGTVMTEILTR